MSWEEIKLAANYLLIGFVIGFAWQPLWNLIRRCREEFQLARDEWRNPRG